MHNCPIPTPSIKVWGLEVHESRGLVLCNFLFLGLSASFRLGEVEHLVKQLEVVVVDDGEVFGDIDIGNLKGAHMIEGFINISLAELHEIPG